MIGHIQSPALVDCVTTTKIPHEYWQRTGKHVCLCQAMLGR